MHEVTDGLDFFACQRFAVVLFVERGAAFPDFFSGERVGDFHIFGFGNQTVKGIADRHRDGRAERACGEIVFIHEIGCDVVIPRVTDQVGLGDFVAGESRFIAVEGDGCGMEFIVCSGDLKIFGGLAVFGFEFFGVAERYDGFSVFDLEGVKERRVGDKVLFAVGVLEREQSETCADVLFVARVNVAEIADVVCDGHCGVFVLIREFLLGFPEDREAVRVAVVERGKLYEVERHVGFVELFAPGCDKSFHLFVVKCAVTHIGAALIPDCAFECEFEQRVDHCVEQHGRLLVIVKTQAVRETGQVGKSFLVRGGDFCFRNPFFHIGNGFFVGGVALFRSGNVGEERIVDAAQFRLGGETAGAGPRFNACSAPVDGDQADRDVERLVEIAAEEVCDGGEVADAARRADLPASAGDIVLRLHGGAVEIAVENTDRGQIGFLDFLTGVVGIVQSPFHVGLTGTDPDVADDNVFKPDLIFPFDDQVGTFEVRFHGIQSDLPFSVCGSGFLRLPLECHCDFFPVVRPSPDICLGVPLEDHVVAENARHFHVCTRLKAEHCGCRGEQKC